MLAALALSLLAQVDNCRPGTSCIARGYYATASVDGGVSHSAKPGTCYALDGTFIGNQPTGAAICSSADGKTLQLKGAAVTGAGGWQLVLDCDFTAQPFQALDGGDGTSYSICGVPWTTLGSLSANIALDAGLVIQRVDAGTGNNASCGVGANQYWSGIQVPLTTLYPSVGGDTGLRVCVYYKGLTHSALGNDYSEVALLSQSFTGADNVGPCISVQYNTNPGWEVFGYDYAAAFQYSSPTAGTFSTAENVYCFTIRDGFNQNDVWSVDGFDGGRPHPGHELGFGRTATNLTTGNASGSTIENFFSTVNLSLRAIGAQKDGPTVTYGRVTLEVQP